jgi:hypothetical protein
MGLVPKQILSFEELLTLQMVQQEALTTLLVEMEKLTQKEFWGKVRMFGSRNNEHSKGRDRNCQHSWIWRNELRS